MLFMPFLFAICFAGAGVSYWLISTFSGESFDRDLINSSDSIVGRLRVKNGSLIVDLPPAAQAILKHSESDKLYYRVISLDGRVISGDKDLPPPSRDLQIDVPKVRWVNMPTGQIRLAEVKTKPDEATEETVIVQLAATTHVRTVFQRKMLMSIVIPQVVALLLGLSAIYFGVVNVLRPVKILHDEVISRSPSDLSALPDRDIPEEIYPLVSAINNLLNRLRDEIKLHQRFIANAAHQLRTPLAGLKTFSSIGSEMSDAGDLKKIVREVDHGVDRASRMVSQLLALARTDADPSINAMKKLDLNFLVSDIVEELINQAIQKDIELKYEHSTEPAVIFGQQTSLKHLITNLIENAIIYTPSGGEVTVNVRGGRDVVLSVADTGPGIAPSERARVFERFYRIVGSNGNGSGLGLSIVQEVAKMHKAQVEIQSASSGGTLVIVAFPPTPAKNLLAAE